MDKIDLYTKEEIDKLKTYYKDKVIGKTFDLKTPFKIDGFLVEKQKTKYQLICVGYFIKKDSVRLKTDISTVCKDYSLLSPLEVLKGQG